MIPRSNWSFSSIQAAHQPNALTRYVLGALLIVAPLSVVPSALADSAENYRVGAILGLTGPGVEFGEASRRGLEFGFEHATRNTPHRVELVVEDSRMETPLAVKSFVKMRDIDRIKVFFIQGSGPVLAVKPLLSNGDAFVFSSAAHPKLLEGSPYLFRHSNTADRDAEYLIEDIRSQVHIRSIDALALENDWAVAFMDRFTALAKESSILVRTHYVKPDDLFLRDILTAVRRNNPDAILVSTFGIQASTVAIRARQSGFAGPIFANNGFALTNENFAAIRKAGLKNFSYQAYNEPPAAFVEAYRARYGEPPTFFTYLAFQDAELIAEALHKSKGDVSALQRHFASLKKFSGTYGELTVSREREILEPTKLRPFSNH